jgi:hypothetical protein
MGNLLMIEKAEGEGIKSNLVPIDHGFILSECLKDNATFDWITFDAFDRSWPDNIKKKVRSMEWNSIKKGIKEAFPGISASLLRTIQTNFVFLQSGIEAGLTPNQMAAWMNGSDIWSISKFTGEAGSLLRHCFEKASSRGGDFSQQITQVIGGTIRKFKEAQAILKTELQTQFPDNQKRQAEVIAYLQAHTEIDKYSALSGRPPLLDLFYQAILTTDIPNEKSRDFDSAFTAKMTNEIQDSLKKMPRL